jgi:glycerophosphoryl diester phosphodiesterase
MKRRGANTPRHGELRKEASSRRGFEFLRFKIQRGKARFRLARERIKSRLNRQNLYAIPTQKSVDRFKDQIRAMTRRTIPLRLGELIEKTRSSADGATTTAAPMSDGVSINWTAVVPSRQAMAQRLVEALSRQTVEGRVQAGQPCLTHTFPSPERPFIKAGCGKTARPV